ncbi:HET-C protein [Pyricularia oryzae 70-15]|uniref:HET-C protein n=1 Tax=Pyricularia oryzae (strain 70-15 / ATCC MYA-4617 / FGSC 8958) TaxID=242507 RepID=G4NH70_PYRO7|nr:HET-C protein [Pyricularia oryzae 70-15]EHA47580.1 HET-C protein [Pyricularia oryzae 70-15]
MAISQVRWGTVLLVLGIVLVVMPGKAAAFGAGNIPSISQVEGHNWRHGDIEDMLQTLLFLKGKKWSSKNISRVYFGNWLRDYSQAVDVGSLKGVNAETVRILVWVLSFLSFGYATAEFEVTADRLGVYRPEEHIDNPLGYGDGKDAREFDPRLRGPVDPRELEVDPRTGMKNYIANESGGWATSVGYLRFSFARCIHFGRVYTHGSRSGKEEDLCEALRCLGQALHCMEDFSAHSNYCELALRELGNHDVYPHCGTSTEINLNGRRVYPLVTGTFGAVDFLHSVIGEATDNLTQSEVDEMNEALISAQNITKPGAGDGSRSLFGSSGDSTSGFISLIDKLPGVGNGFASEARALQAESAAQDQQNQTLSRANQVPGMSPDFDAVATAKKIYPILAFRDKIVRAISDTISKIPGMEKLLERIGETLTAFVLGLLAPFVRPIINGVSKVLKDGSSGVIASSSNSQLEPWKDPSCSNPTHSMLSKDHFTNVLNSCAGRVASTVLQYVVPRVLFAWDNPGVPVDEVVNDVIRAFHHPAARNEQIDIQKQMFETVRKWSNESHHVIRLLSSESVKAGKNHVLANGQTATKSLGGHDGHAHGPTGFPAAAMRELGGHGKVSGSLWSQVKTRDMGAMSSGPSGAAAPPEPDYSTRPQADTQPSYNQPAPPATYGYGQPGQPQSYGQPQGYQPQHQQHPPQPAYGSAPYGGQSPYPPQPPYGQQPPYQQQAPYQQAPAPYGQPAPYPPQQPYPQQSPYPQQPPYGQQPPYQQQPPHGHQGGWGQYPGQRY